MWILWLKANTSHHVDVIFDQSPTDEPMLDQIISCNENDDNNDEVDADAGGVDHRPEKENATGDVEGHETTHSV